MGDWMEKQWVNYIVAKYCRKIELYTTKFTCFIDSYDFSTQRRSLRENFGHNRPKIRLDQAQKTASANRLSTKDGLEDLDFPKKGTGLLVAQRVIQNCWHFQ